MQEFFPEIFQKMKHLKDPPEMHCRNFKVPVMKDNQIIGGSQNSIFASCAFVNSHKDLKNCQDGITGIFCTEKTKENETEVARHLPFTVLLEYKLLNDENDIKGVGIEIRGGDIFFSHTRKEWHGSQKVDNPQRGLLVC